MHYCGVVPLRGVLQLAILEEVRATEPPIRLSALFFEPGSADQLAAELRSLGGVVVGVGAPLTSARGASRERDCDALLARRGVAPRAPDTEALRFAQLLDWLTLFAPAEALFDDGVPDGAYRDFPLFETNADAVFCALQARRLPAKRHPFGMLLRIEELAGDHVTVEGGTLWHRRIEELDAIACALCAHRYAVGHACWLGDPDEGVVVLPGSSLPDEFSREGVVPPAERIELPRVTDR
jgi:predicted nuclease with RNAse H fold